MPWVFVKSNLMFLFMRRYWLGKAHGLMTAVPYESANFVTYFCDSDGRDRIHMPKEWFEKRILVKFEDAELYAPAGYDEYLKNYYGDYMVLPPADKRVHRSHGEFFWRAR